MHDLLVRWPFWYWALVIYTGYRGISALREYQKVFAPWIADAASKASSPREHGWVFGARARHLLPAILWTLGAAGLVIGLWWMRVLVGLAYLLPIRQHYRGFATGAATGRKSAELAAAIEYVQGRATPRPLDFTLAAIFVTATCLLPAAAALYSTWILPT